MPVLSVVGALLVAESLVYVLARHAGLVVNAQSAGILDGAGRRCGSWLVALCVYWLSCV